MTQGNVFHQLLISLQRSSECRGRSTGGFFSWPSCI